MNAVGKPLNCMVTKLIPADRIESFAVEHYIRSSKPVKRDEFMKSALYFAGNYVKKNT